MVINAFVNNAAHSDSQNAPVLTIAGGRSTGAAPGPAATGDSINGNGEGDELSGCSGNTTASSSSSPPIIATNSANKNDSTASASPVDSLVVPAPTPSGLTPETASSTAAEAASTVTAGSKGYIGGSSIASPVLSRDFATLVNAKTRDGKTAHTEGWIAHQATPGGADTKPVIHPAPVTVLPADVTSGPTSPRGRVPALAAPRLQSLRNLVRASSEPALPRTNKEKVSVEEGDLEKGAITIGDASAAGAAGGNLAAGRASEPNLPRNPRLVALLEPEKPLKPPPTWRTSAINIAKYSYLNLLLVFIPVAFASEYAHLGSTATFCTSFMAIIPLAALLGFATEELALRVGHTLGGLLNATLGNTVELIIAILALTKGELRVVQSSMIGSILSNCLLVLGCCFFAGGIRFHEQIYTIRSAQLNISLLGISSLVIVIPAAFNASVVQLNVVPVAVSDRDILKISRGVAVILLFVYAAYLFFQLWTHSYLYRTTPVQQRSTLHRTRTIEDDDEPQPPIDSSVLRIPSWHTSSSGHSDGTTSDGSSTSPSSSSSSSSSSSDDDDAETPKLSVYAAIVLMLAVAGLTGVIAEFLVSSIDGLVSQGGVSREFVALILLPLVGNAAEHICAVTVSVKDKLDLSLAVAVGSSIQIALFVIPFLVILGWIIGQPLSLEFDVLETITLFVAIVIVNQAISDGKSNWLEGLTLMVCYLYVSSAHADELSADMPFASLGSSASSSSCEFTSLFTW